MINFKLKPKRNIKERSPHVSFIPVPPPGLSLKWNPLLHDK